MRPLAPLLIGLLAACRATDSDSSSDTSWWTNCGGHETFARALTAEEAATYSGDDGVMDDSECVDACYETVAYGDAMACEALTTNADGSVDLTCGYDLICEGRRFAGLRRASSGSRVLGRGGSRPDTTPPSAEQAVGAAWLARAAHAEAASVTAFRRLAAELRLHGAPAQLVDAALTAAHDEVGHARVMRRLALARGGTPPRVRAKTARTRSLAAFAVENAVEGCVNETWAALVALHQAAEAADPEVRAALAQIAEDEIRHAELARAVDAWALPRLSARERARVERARRGAASKIAAARYPAVLGLPDAGRVARLHAAMTREVWSRVDGVGAA